MLRAAQPRAGGRGQHYGGAGPRLTSGGEAEIVQSTKRKAQSTKLTPPFRNPSLIHPH